MIGSSLPPLPGEINGSANLPCDPPPLLEDDVLHAGEKACLDGAGQQDNLNSDAHPVRGSPIEDHHKGASSELVSALAAMRKSQSEHEERIVQLLLKHEKAVQNAVSDIKAELHNTDKPSPVSPTLSTAKKQTQIITSPQPPPRETLPDLDRFLVSSPSKRSSAERLSEQSKCRTTIPADDETTRRPNGSEASTRKSEANGGGKPRKTMMFQTLGDAVSKLKSNRKTQMSQKLTVVDLDEVDGEEGDKSAFLGFRQKRKSMRNRIENILENRTEGGGHYYLSNTKDAMKRVQGVQDEDWENMRFVKLQKLVNNDKFDLAVVSLIVINSLMLGLQIDHTAEFGRDSPGLQTFNRIEQCFLVFFIAEWVLRILTEGMEYITGDAKLMHLTDTTIVLSGIFEQVIMATTPTSSSADEDDDSGTLFAALRILRLLRLGRSVRLMEFSSDLRALVQGLLFSVRSLAWAVLFLNILMYIFCILVMEFTIDYFPGGRNYPGDPPLCDRANMTGVEFARCEEEAMGPTIKGDTMPHQGLQVELQWYFGNVPRGMLTLFRCISGGVDWGKIGEPLKHVSWMMVILFSVFIGVCVFAVLNVITCIFLENAKKLALRDKATLIYDEVQERNWLADSLRTMFICADTNQSGVLEWPEFQAHFEDPIVQAYFRRLGIDIEALGVRTLWEMFDFECQNRVDVETFVVGTLHLQGGAKSIDLHRLRMELDERLSNLEDATLG